jgi:hypothetical protein
MLKNLKDGCKSIKAFLKGSQPLQADIRNLLYRDWQPC